MVAMLQCNILKFFIIDSFMGEKVQYIIPCMQYMTYIWVYTEQDIFFVYNGASVPWIISINKCRFSINISKTL